jgi:hypothetical protein
VWWGHDSDASGNPTSQSTRLGRALYEMWEDLKTNQQGGSGAALSYADVGYWDYEYTSATHLYIFGHGAYGIFNKYYYCTIPSGVTVYSATLNYGTDGGSWLYGYIDAVLRYSGVGVSDLTNGFVCVDQTPVFTTNYGVQKTIRHRNTASNKDGNQAIVLLTSG